MKKIISFLIAFTHAHFSANAADSVNVSVNITSHTTWSASNTYVLKDYIFVEPGATLTIEAGTTIKADVGSGDGAPALIVTQGAKINAVGTASAPIVFTSVNDTGSNLTKDDKGLWGGLIILGNAPINSNGGSNADNSPLTNTIEGVPTTSGISGKTIPASYAQYGGTNASDNSGVLQYVSIRHGGAEIGAGNEINGLTLGGVGNGTTMDHIEIFANKDDGIEFFGGSVNAKYLTVAYVGDDSFDIDEGYNGHLQFLLSIQDENSNRAFEWDGSTESDDRAADTSTLPSYSAPVISNVTAIGIGKDGTSNHEDNNIGLEIRDNAGGQIWNSIFTEFAKSIMDVEKTASSKGTQSTTDTSVYGSQALMQNGTLVFKGNLFYNGGHADGNTVFYDGNTAAGETITFPAHSYSYGKTRIAETITAETNTTHEVDNELGLHGTSIKTTGTNSGFLIGEDSAPGNNFDFKGDTSWCMEFWIYPTSAPAGAFMGNMTPNSGPGHAGIVMYDYNNSSSRHEGIIWANDAGTTYYWVTDYSVITNDTWQHVVLQHDAFDQTYATPGTSPTGHKNITMFVNGVNIAWADAASSDTSYDNRLLGNAKLAGHTSHGKRFHIGYDMDNNRIAALWDEIRVTKGIPRYTPDGRMVQGIVPNKATGAGTLGTLIPTTPYLRPTPYVATDGGRGYFANSNVKLWVKSDTVPGDTSFYDSAGTIGNTPKNITNTGHTTANQPIIKNANSVTDYALSGGADGIYFDGTNDKIMIPYHDELHFGQGGADYTYESWIYMADGTSPMFLFDARDGTYTSNWYLYYDHNSDSFIWQDGVGSYNWRPPDIVASKWQHIGIQKRDGAVERGGRRRAARSCSRSAKKTPMGSNTIHSFPTTRALSSCAAPSASFQRVMLGSGESGRALAATAREEVVCYVAVVKERSFI